MAVVKIETPESCWKCQLKYLMGDAFRCCLSGKNVYNKANRHTSCKLEIEDESLKWVYLTDKLGNQPVWECPICKHKVFVSCTNYCAGCGKKLAASKSERPDEK